MVLQKQQERGEKRKKKNGVLGVCKGLVDYVAGRKAIPWLPDFANAHSTRHGARPGPTLAPWCIGGSVACLAAESARRPAAEREKFVFREKKSTLYIKILLSLGRNCSRAKCRSRGLYWSLGPWAGIRCARVRFLNRSFSGSSSPVSASATASPPRAVDAAPRTLRAAAPN